MPGIRNQADVEYAVMLTVLNFQQEFMQSHYSRIQVRLRDDVISVDLTRSAPIPVEERLAQTQQGRDQLRQMHQALFAAGQDILKQQLEDALGRRIEEMAADLDLLSGKSTMVIRLNGTIESSG